MSYNEGYSCEANTSRVGYAQEQSVPFVQCLLGWALAPITTEYVALSKVCSCVCRMVTGKAMVIISIAVVSSIRFFINVLRDFFIFFFPLFYNNNLKFIIIRLMNLWFILRKYFNNLSLALNNKKNCQLAPYV